LTAWKEWGRILSWVGFENEKRDRFNSGHALQSISGRENTGRSMEQKGGVFEEEKENMMPMERDE
jgi:hypothetical protein